MLLHLVDDFKEVVLAMHGEQGYENFIISFEKMSPFELDYFIKIFFSHFNQYEIEQTSTLSHLTAINLKNILIETMRTAHVEVAERRVKEAQRGLDLTRSRVYKATSPENAES